jgi:hypothetical protein
LLATAQGKQLLQKNKIDFALTDFEASPQELIQTPDLVSWPLSAQAGVAAGGS